MSDAGAWIAALSPFVLIGYIWLSAAFAGLFRKAGEAVWAGWVPVANLVVFLRLGGFGWAWALCTLVPGAGAILLGVSSHRIGRVLGYRPGMTVLAVLLFPVWISVAAWGQALYQGAQHPATTRQRSRRPRASGPSEFDRYLRESEPEGPWPFGDTLTDVLGLRRRTGLRSTPAQMPGTTSAPKAPAAQVDAPMPPAQPVPPMHPVRPTPAPVRPSDGIPPTIPVTVYIPPRPPLPMAPVPVPVPAATGLPRWQLTGSGGQTAELTRDVAVIGRRPRSDAAFPEAQLVSVSDATRTMSKTHARLERRGGRWRIRDLGSTNGVIVFDASGVGREIPPGSAEIVHERVLLGDVELRLASVVTPVAASSTGAAQGADLVA